MISRNHRLSTWELECWSSEQRSKSQARSKMYLTHATVYKSTVVFSSEPSKQNITISLQEKRNPDVLLCTSTHIEGKQVS